MTSACISAVQVRRIDMPHPASQSLTAINDQVERVIRLGDSPGASIKKIPTCFCQLTIICRKLSVRGILAPRPTGGLLRKIESLVRA